MPAARKDTQRKMESSSRMWAESQPGPSRSQPCRQGYCGYCRVIYNSLDQHLSSSRHTQCVRASSRGSSTVSSVGSSRTSSLMERFLQDVLQHHPHDYNDYRPSHADLPSLSTPLLPREELAELCVSNDDSRSLGTREDLPSSDDASCQLEDDGQSEVRVTEEAGQERPSSPIPEQETRPTPPATAHTHSPNSHTQPQTQSSHPHTQPHVHPCADTHTHSPPAHTHTHPPSPPSVHRKAHRKTNRRRQSDSSSDLPPKPPCSPPRAQTPPPCTPSRRQAPPPWSPPGGPAPPQTESRAWLSWEKERREAHREEAFSSDHTDPMDQTIEEVIQAQCYGLTSTPCQQGETESFHFSLPGSPETESDDWDAPVQVVFERGGTLTSTHTPHTPVQVTHPPHTPVQVSQTEGQDLSCLMEVHVDLEDQVYAHQLDSALHSERRGKRRKEKDEGYRVLPVEEILPAPPYIPETFRGKTWVQIEQEDEEKVENLVRQFRQGRFLCYFDSESLARYGRRSKNKKGRGQNKEPEPEPDVLPLFDHDEDNPAHVRRKRKRRMFRQASRCQVVKVSHSTQTVPVVVPAVRQPAPEVLPTPASVQPANQESRESPDEAKTPEIQTALNSLRLPSSYTRIITPLQPRTSVVYLLCSPENPFSEHTPPKSSTPKRCRKRKRPLEHDVQGLKVKYKRLPFRFYDPNRNQILKNAPKGFLSRRSSASSSSKPPPTCVRQLFRSLSPDLNSERLGREGGRGGRSKAGSAVSGSSGVKVKKSSDTTTPPFSQFDLGDLKTPKQEVVRRRGGEGGARDKRGGRTPPTSPPPPLRSGRAGRGRGGRRERTRPPPPKRRGRESGMPAQPKRGGSRRTGQSRKLPSSKSPASPPTRNPTSAHTEVSPSSHSSRRVRKRKGRGCPCCEEG